MYICIYIYVCMYMYIGRHAHRTGGRRPAGKKHKKKKPKP